MNAANRIEHVRRQMELTLGGGLEGISHIIWPEAAVPFFLNERADLRAALAEIVPPGGSLITGAPALDRPTGGGEPRLYNSLYALDGTGRISARYDKVHLVPFGEFVPLGRLIGMTKLTAGRIDFTPGPGARSLQVEGLPPFSPQICYEVIFSGQVVAETGARPGWLLNLTNDAWFGRSSGPYQHFANVRLRAVEEGLPLIRSANNGISAVIDPYGRLRARLGLDEIGVIDTALPAPVARMTPYAQIGRWVILPLFVLLVLAGALIHRRRRSAATA
jgi:apolipoprotein N-acyltransferase